MPSSPRWQQRESSPSPGAYPKGGVGGTMQKKKLRRLRQRGKTQSFQPGAGRGWGEVQESSAWSGVKNDMLLQCSSRNIA